jgi:hypothetical protein
MNDQETRYGTVIPIWSSSLFFIRSIFGNIAHKLIVRRVRSREQVASDYDQGEWRDALLSRQWESCQALEDYVYGTSNSEMVALLDGRLRRVAAKDYYKFRAELLVKTLSEYCGSAERLVEIGSGAGRNLFALAHAGRWQKLHGVEISTTGREVTSKVATHFGIDNVETSHIDLLNPDSDGFRELRDATAFSFYCLEQLPAYTKTVMLNLLSAGIRRVVHIEPTPELFSRVSPRDLATVTYIWRQNYQRSLVETARALEKEGRINVIEVRRLNFAPTCRNDPTLVVWEPAHP